MTTAQTTEHKPKTDRQWKLLAQSLSRLAEEASSEALMMRLVDVALSIVPQAERGLVTLDERGHGFPDFRVGRGVDGSEIRVAGEVSRRLLARAFESDVVWSSGLHTDHRFKGLESIRQAPDRSVILTGFHVAGAFRGVLYLEAKEDLIQIAEDRKDRLITLVRTAAPMLARILENERARDLECYHHRLFAGELDLPDIVVASTPMRRVVELAGRIASSANGWPVLIAGESGTGKELIANVIHEKSKRSGGNFVKVACGGLTAELGNSELFGHEKGAFSGATRKRLGMIREADGGTLFLDDVDKLAPALQGALLRAIQFNEVRPLGAETPLSVDFRTITTSSSDLRVMAREGTFLPDLFARLTGWIIALPPLRDRSEEIVPLARRFAQRCAHEVGYDTVPVFTEAAYRKLRSHHYRDGNVRELEQCVKRAVALSLADGSNHIMPDLVAFTDELLDPQVERDVEPFAKDRSQMTLAEVRAGAEREHIRAAIEAYPNRSQAAQALAISPANLHVKLNRYGLR